jgi:hypothetical protein
MGILITQDGLRKWTTGDIRANFQHRKIFELPTKYIDDLRDVGRRRGGTHAYEEITKVASFPPRASAERRANVPCL